MYFTNVKNGEELKNKYRNLCKKHHPDKGGDVKVMQQINAEYEKLKKEFSQGSQQQQKSYNEKAKSTKADEAAKKAKEEKEKAEREAQRKQEEKKWQDERNRKKAEFHKKQKMTQAEKLKTFLENKKKSDDYFKAQTEKEMSFTSAYFPHLKEVLCIAIGGGQRYLNAWEIDKFITHLKTINVPFKIHKNHLEYQVSKKK